MDEQERYGIPCDHGFVRCECSICCEWRSAGSRIDLPSLWPEAILLRTRLSWYSRTTSKSGNSSRQRVKAESWSWTEGEAGDAPCWEGRLARRGYNNRWTGIVLNGFIRDGDEINGCPIGLWSLGSVLLRPKKTGVG
ncbi:hypothetical protein CDL15_Pgr007168 [Punica granatum]|uniref:Uncharacterized protein n=1 Tax=Punica granatum TaxID=22663 RepID=A0A218X864_PUNGR|nr:hypothetical protein CDL15_Pgr007168 [Punica granatum]